MGWEIDYTKKIDDEQVNGLQGVHDSLAYKVNEIEKHFHSLERWYGNSGGTGGSVDANLTEWQATAGTGEAFGTEVLILSGNNITNNDFGFTPVYFDMHRILISSASATNALYVIQFWGGTDTFGNATLISETVYYAGTAVAQSAPVDIRMNRQPAANKIWARIKSETNSATLDFVVGVHAYEG